MHTEHALSTVGSHAGYCRRCREWVQTKKVGGLLKCKHCKQPVSAISDCDTDRTRVANERHAAAKAHAVDLSPVLSTSTNTKATPASDHPLVTACRRQWLNKTCRLTKRYRP